MEYTISALLKKADDLVEQFEYDGAERFYEKALQMEPNNTTILDSYAYVKLELDKLEDAQQLFKRSIELSPNENHVKYMSFAQTLQGSDALSCFAKGIELMYQEIKNLENQNEFEKLIGLKREISVGLSSMAEIYLTDACFEDCAESECERLLQEALSIDPSNPDPLQTLASVRLSQHRSEDALQLLNKSFEIWKDSEEMPSYELRHSTAKLFLEMEQFDSAIDIWEILLLEDDSFAEVHYFLGLAYRTTDPKTSLECLNKAKDLLIQSKCDDVKLMQEINLIISEVEVESSMQIDL